VTYEEPSAGADSGAYDDDPPLANDFPG